MYTIYTFSDGETTTEHTLTFQAMPNLEYLMQVAIDKYGDAVTGWTITSIRTAPGWPLT